ncbi:GLPGLI family protein [Arachidicoccus ginsenosidivorans]|uniref:GLPGLI family protein n=1 Tax=Arachidicoccus ginsenosidivorans TaxID=496057 RepID=A0A5B8VMT5_9BACT|nr:GLPGLI family protein [Arachidicoccus ginsenosidivorans]QEC72381.1 GLPGLI family protein [Arachidicoccus ginsenosidivorans]
MNEIQIVFQKRALLLIFLSILFAINIGKAQYAQFIGEGTIIFKKRINLDALIKKRFYDKNDYITNKLITDYKASYPSSFRTIEYSLNFNKDRSIYSRLTNRTADEDLRIGEVEGCDNIILTDFKKKKLDINLPVSGQHFFISDTLPKIVWKITNEVRDIAGFSCRRANGLMMDSLYVVAFFTPQIPVPSGPEIANGLPGMILGLAVPSLHTTWFASSVQSKSINNAPHARNEGKKIIRLDEYVKEISSNLMNWQIQQSLL